MPHTITRTTYQLSQNGHHSTYHFSIISDGVSADLSDYVLVDPVVDHGKTSASRMVIECVDYNFIGFDAYLTFDSGNPVDDLAWCLNSEHNATQFDRNTGVKDQSGASGTGKIQLNTIGLTTAGSVGTMILKVRNA